ncbi:hypothetical protein [Streptomyces viridochromogenes]|nr:hypothetical protein [Streptomyces viridochromogenes]
MPSPRTASPGLAQAQTIGHQQDEQAVQPQSPHEEPTTVRVREASV